IKWVGACAECGLGKLWGRQPCAPLQPSVVGRPFKRVAVDLLGLLPETGKGNKYIMVVGDYFSKWTEAFPLPSQEARNIAKVLTEEWVCRYGVPRSLRSDQELCRLLQIPKSRTSPYHPQSDGLVERFNRTLWSMLTLFVEDNQLNWNALLPYIMLAYRSSAHASTLVTPYKVLFGREIMLPVDVMLDVGNQAQFSSVDEYVTTLQETLYTVVEAVKSRQVKASVRQQSSYDLRAKFEFYAEGEEVWVRNKARRRGVCPKLQRHYKGLYRLLYRVVPVQGGLECVIHFNRLKPCTSSLAVSAPLAVGSRGREWRRSTQTGAAWSGDGWTRGATGAAIPPTIGGQTRGCIAQEEAAGAED
uniref:Integrase catalytic domain-containing protein n=1 Tax=Nothobranchius furzeri TaxID=105023 RepID=A0A8C6MBU6_NOTFU